MEPADPLRVENDQACERFSRKSICSATTIDLGTVRYVCENARYFKKRKALFRPLLCCPLHTLEPSGISQLQPSVLPGTSIPGDDDRHRLQEDVDIEPEGSVTNVVLIECILFFRRNEVASVDLGPTCDAGNDFQFSVHIRLAAARF